MDGLQRHKYLEAVDLEDNEVGFFTVLFACDKQDFVQKFLVSRYSSICGVSLYYYYYNALVKPKFHLARLDTFDVSSSCILAVSTLSNSTARLA